LAWPTCLLIVFPDGKVLTLQHVAGGGFFVAGLVVKIRQRQRAQGRNKGGGRKEL
jgi:hypothetical protein